MADVKRVLVVLALIVAACGNAATPTLPAEELQIEALPAVQADLAATLGVGLDEIQPVTVEDAEWPDACLGLGRPDESCAAEMTPGYRITLEVGGTQYVYRADKTGTIFRLEETTQ